MGAKKESNFLLKAENMVGESKFSQRGYGEGAKFFFFSSINDRSTFQQPNRAQNKLDVITDITYLQ